MGRFIFLKKRRHKRSEVYALAVILETAGWEKTVLLQAGLYKCRLWSRDWPWGESPCLRRRKVLRQRPVIVGGTKEQESLQMLWVSATSHMLWLTETGAMGLVLLLILFNVVLLGFSFTFLTTWYRTCVTRSAIPREPLVCTGQP